MAWNDTYNSLNSTTRSLYDKFSDYQSKGQWNSLSRTDGEGQKYNYWKAGSGSNSFILDDRDYKQYSEWYKQAQTYKQQQEAAQAARIKAEQEAAAQKAAQEAAQKAAQEAALRAQQQQEAERLKAEAAQRQQQQQPKQSFYNLATTQRTPVTTAPLLSGTPPSSSSSPPPSPSKPSEMDVLMSWLTKELQARKAEADASRKQLEEFYAKQSDTLAGILQGEKAARSAADAERKAAAAKAEEEAAKTKKIRDETNLKNSIEQERLDKRASKARRRRASKGVMSSSIGRMNSGVSLFGSIT